jgi:hypothetical protein
MSAAKRKPKTEAVEPMSFAELVRYLAERGVQGEVEGGDLVLSNLGELPEHVKVAVRAHRKALVAGIQSVMPKAVNKARPMLGVYTAPGVSIESVQDADGVTVPGLLNVWRRI